MTFPAARRVAVFLAGLLTVSGFGALPGGAAPVQVTPAPDAAYAADAPDPAVVRVGSTYYAYTTGTTWGNHIGVLSSTSPATGWHTANGARFGSSALPNVPSWQRMDTQNAPGVFSFGGRWIMFYDAVDKASGNYCLSIATASAPAGPFRDDSTSPWFCHAEYGGAIDPSPFVDSDGRAWLLWKSNDGSSTQPARLWSAPLDASGMALAGAPVVLLTQDTTRFPWETTIENPQLVLANGSYVLLFSAGAWDSPNYGEGYAACSGPAGPCLQNANPFLTSYGSVAGPGGGSAFTDANGGWWLAYQGWTSPCTSYACGGARRLYVAPLQVGGAAGRVGCSAPATPAGYRVVGADGAVYSYGNIPYCGSTAGTALNTPMIAAAPTPDAGGYWLVAGDGGIFSFGNAQFFGSTGAMRLNQPIVGMASTPDGGGYWLVAGDGGIFSFGNARFFGSTGAMRLNQPIVGMAAAPGGGGYWLVARDGGIFAFGNARFFGSTGAIRLNQPIVGMTTAPGGSGYWLVAGDGGIFAFGSAGFFGSTGALGLNQPIVGIAATRTGAGYLLVASDGGVFIFGDARFLGAPASLPLAAPIVGLA